MICAICGKEFEPKDVAKTCSQSCRGKLKALNRRKRQGQFTCLYCGKTKGQFYPDQKYCNHECKTLHEQTKEQQEHPERFIKCQICGEFLRSRMTQRHLDQHNYTTAQYKEEFGTLYAPSLLNKISDTSNGRTHSKETKAKMSKTHKAQFAAGERKIYNPWDNMTDEQKEKLKKENGDRLRIAIRTPSVQKKRVATRQAKGWYTPEMKEKMAKQMLKNNRYGGRSKKGYYFAKKCQRKGQKKFMAFYRSSYELAAMKLLDADPDVAYWEYEPFGIPYTDLNGDEKKYFPDFLIEFSDARPNMLLEVKPDALMNTPENELKHQALVNYCKEHELDYNYWTEVELIH